MCNFNVLNYIFKTISHLISYDFDIPELTKLTLWTIPEDESDSLLSVALISHGLLGLPKLQDLFLFVRFNLLKYTYD